MDETVRRHQSSDLYITSLIARWRAPISTLAWVNCGHTAAYLADLDGSLQELEGPVHDALGSGPARRQFTVTKRRLMSGDRLILVTDGITNRRTQSGVFGVDGIRNTLADLQDPTAAATAMALLQAVSDCWKEPLEDDGTVLVLCIT